MKKEYIEEIIGESIATKNLLLESKSCISSIFNLAEKSLESLNLGGKIILAGNGGSFGASGLTGANGNVSNGSAGGAAGNYINGISNVTLNNTGTVAGGTA